MTSNIASYLDKKERDGFPVSAGYSGALVIYLGFTAVVGGWRSNEARKAVRRGRQQQ